MSRLKVFFGYKEAGEYHGYLGEITKKEYEKMKRLAERASSPDELSTEALLVLSDVKDLLVQAKGKFGNVELMQCMNSEKRMLKHKKISDAINKAINSISLFEDEAGKLSFLWEFCLLDAEYALREEAFTLTEEGTTQLEKDVVQIPISEELLNTLVEFIEEADIDGRREINDALISIGDSDAEKTVIDYLNENMGYYADADSDWILVLFRTLRNNVLKCHETGKELRKFELF